MTGARFTECLQITRRTRRGYAVEIGGRVNTLDLWASDRISIPEAIAVSLEREVRYTLRFREKYPAPKPQDWRRRRRTEPAAG